jgi:chemotaxis regulatin CheY-phosphate phosphatase CheZ
MKEDQFITVPARARDEIGQLAHYLEQGLRNIHDITDHLRGSSGTMPSVLDDLRDVVKITEAATVRMLDETEALVEDGRAAARLLAEVRRGAGGAEALAEPIRQLGTLIDRANDRAMEIMAALEFQDLTSQKVHRTFGVLEQVVVRLAKIQRLVDAPNDTAPLPAAPAPIPHDGKTGQRLADELLLHFASNMDV